MGDRGGYRGRGRGRGSSHAQGGAGHCRSASAQQSSTAKKQGNRGSVSLMDLGPMQKDKGKQNWKEPGKKAWDGKESKGFRHRHQGPGNAPRKNYENPPNSHNPPCSYKPMPSYKQNQNPQLYNRRQYCPSTQGVYQTSYSGGYGYNLPPSYDESNREHIHGIVVHPSAPLMGINPNQMSHYGSPPPPYVSTERPASRNSQEKQLQTQSRLTPAELVKALALFEGQWGVVDTLSRHLNRSVEEVDNMVKSQNDIFSYLVNGTEIIVELVPKVSLCSDYLLESGCISHDSCKGLHLCKPFITRSCELGSSCPYGHRLDTNHNTSVLSKFYLDLINKNVLYNVIRKVLKRNVSPQICNFYNSKKGCNRDRCYFLHICKDYVKGAGQCSLRNCSLNHDVFTESIKRQLKHCGISLNESLRDILLNLMSSLKDRGDNQSTSASHSQKSIKDKEKEKHDNHEKSASETDYDSDSSEQGDTAGNTGKSKKKNRGQVCDEGKGKPRKKKIAVCRSTDVSGDVEIPEICLYSVNDRCVNEKRGCKYLHAKSFFHWQVEKDSKWYNLRVYHSKALENSYRDVSKASAQLDPLNPEKIGAQEKEMLKILGKKAWTADFKNMHVRNSSGSETLKIRRISTRSAAVFDNPKATVYEWYFVDEQDKWICYGEVDSLGKKELACLITPEEIEKQYLSDPFSSLIIRNTRFTYKLDFQQMTQTNLQSNKVREIRRRPARLLYQKVSAVGSDSIPNPAHWTSLASSQTHNLVLLDPSKLEYQQVSTRLRLTHPTARIEKIQRLQNPYLWRLLQVKKANLSSRYDNNQMNMQKLFHGIDSNPLHIDTICRENIDWRQEATTSQDYGKGTYFSNSAAVASRHCIPHSSGHSTMILAEVIVGSIDRGAASFTRPPMNIFTNELHDTTVDDVHAPSIFVKYDKSEYYPEYFIEFF